MPMPAARLISLHVCPALTILVPHVGGPVVSGAPTVLHDGLPAACWGDTAICVGPPSSIVKGSATVMIVNKPAARMTDPTAHGGIIVVGFPAIIIAE